MAGRLVDRLDRRRLACMAAALSAAFIAIYPILPKPWLLIALGTVEAIGVAIAIPLRSRCCPSSCTRRRWAARKACSRPRRAR